MYLTNVSLLGKLIWSLLHDHDKLWVQVLNHKYMGNNSIWNTLRHAQASVMWKSIMKDVGELCDGFEYRVNSGDTSLWYYDWVGTGPICSLVDYVHISDTQIRLKDVVEDGSWHLHSLATIIPEAVKEVIQDVRVPRVLYEAVPDCWAWNGSKDECFTTSSANEWLLNKHRNWDVLRIGGGFGKLILLQRCNFLFGRLRTKLS